MSKLTAQLAGILAEAKLRGVVRLCFLLSLFTASCQQTVSPARDAAAASGGQGGSSSAESGGASGTGGQGSAASTGGSTSAGGQDGSAISDGAGGAAIGGTGGVNPSGGAGTGGVNSSGGAGTISVTGSSGAAGRGGSTGSGGTTAQGGSGGSRSTSDAGIAGRGGSGGSGGATSTAGTSAGGTGGQGGIGGSASATDAGAAGQGGGDAGSLASTSLAVRFANMILSKWPDPASIDATAGFEYNHGIVLRGIEQVYRHTGDSRYLTYIQKYIDENVSASGVVDISTTTFVAFDNMQPSVLLPFLYQQTGLAKYQTAADSIRALYNNIPTNGDGGFWHKQSLPDQMWLDGIYMGEPFLARYGAVFGTCGTFCGDTVVTQATLVGQHTLDTVTGLYYHAWWDSNPASATNVKPAWADANGRSPCIWGRAMGWYAMALVDTLDDLPADQTGRNDLLSNLTGLAAGLKTTQDATGLWYQVMDQGNKSGNFLETSASGMFVYALKVAVNRGYIDASYLSVANSGWQGLQTKVTIDASGEPSITGAVQGMNVQNNYAGYVNQATKTNSSHGLCAILLAAAEMEAQ
ncbi:MAG: glycoside hydrolase family 88 protein [Polyangia bacterium]